MKRATDRPTDVLGLLRERGLRMTPQRRAIVAEVLQAQGHISPTAIARKVQGEMPGVNASTVYRTLTLLEEVGVLQHSHVETGAEYHRAAEAEHVHLTCSACGHDDELSLEEAGAMHALVRRHRGFEADLTHFAITGLCAACAKAKGSRTSTRTA
jgi:Fur family ferric uptake transcriptional regulator